MSLCSSCQGASTDMQYDIPGPLIRSGHLTCLSSNFRIDLSGSKCIFFNASRREKHDGVLRFSLSFISNVNCKKVDLKKMCLTCPEKI